MEKKPWCPQSVLKADIVPVHEASGHRPLEGVDLTLPVLGVIKAGFQMFFAFPPQTNLVLTLTNCDHRHFSGPLSYL